MQRLEVPVVAVAAERVAGQRNQRLFDPLHDHRLEVFLEQDAVAIAVDNVALSIQHVVVLDDVLADVEVVGFDLLLRVLDGARDPRVLERHVLFEAEPVHQAGDRRAAEAPHQLVLERHEEARRARIALTASAAAKLVVDAPRLVALGAQHVQAAQQSDTVGVALALRVGLVPGRLALLGCRLG